MRELIIYFINRIGKRIEKRKFTEAPIYIGGCGRSGTTLLLSILSAHREVFACPKELNLLENAQFKESKLITPKFYRLYRTFIQEKIQSTANRYCEKSPSNIRKIPLLEEIHGNNFKLIHIVRDGRDVILSRHPRGEKEYWVEPERWIHDVAIGLQYTDHPNVYMLRYEDLVTNFEEKITEICNFLEIPVSNEILHWHKYARVRQNNALFNGIQEISTTSIGKWKLDKNKERVRELLDKPEAIGILKHLKYL